MPANKPHDTPTPSKKSWSYSVERNGKWYTGKGHTLDEAKAEAERQADKDAG